MQLNAISTGRNPPDEVITVRQVQHFFEHYKDLEPDKWVKMLGWGDAQEAKQIIVDSIERARSHAKR
jgi:inorganic pyrophosphatase